MLWLRRSFTPKKDNSTSLECWYCDGPAKKIFESIFNTEGKPIVELIMYKKSTYAHSDNK